MATWIAHMRVAENLLERIEGLDDKWFAIGNIAPDSGIPDEKWETFTPPAEVTHFQGLNNTTWTCADLEFYKRYIIPCEELSEDRAQYSFLLGYFFHLVTDNLWNQQIHQPTVERYKNEFDKDQGFIWKVKRDWYGLDFIHVHENPESIFWQSFLGSEYQEDYLDFLPPDAVKHNIGYIGSLYQDGMKDIEKIRKRPFVYLTSEEMDRFIENTTTRLSGIYKTLRAGKMDISGLSSILDIGPQ
jgi:hypothetical protein